MISWLIRLVSKTAREQHRHDQIVNGYRAIATTIGAALSDMGLGDPWIRQNGITISIRDPELYHILDEREEEYASLGYRIIPLEDWIDYGGWGVDIEHLWLIERGEGERPKFTKLEPKHDLPAPSELLQKVWETGKHHEAYRDENGDILYRELLGD